jgi:hypothetical protein
VGRKTRHQQLKKLIAKAKRKRTTDKNDQIIRVIVIVGRNDSTKSRGNTID